jgi:hypothetical protein
MINEIGETLREIRQRRLKAFAEEYGQEANGLESFLSMEATFDNAETDLELIRNGFMSERFIEVNGIPEFAEDGKLIQVIDDREDVEIY